MYVYSTSIIIDMLLRVSYIPWTRPWMMMLRLKGGLPYK